MYQTRTKSTPDFALVQIEMLFPALPPRQKQAQKTKINEDKISQYNYWTANNRVGQRSQTDEGKKQEAGLHWRRQTRSANQQSQRKWGGRRKRESKGRKRGEREERTASIKVNIRDGLYSPGSRADFWSAKNTNLYFFKRPSRRAQVSQI
ncbi:hypothetical protein BJX66DRAFT_7927 [Aspergillus keveii]|uniref:Uncharacterized protein n=1 Tax=Aspergillus keveii TaxID=714993 RepID=A0ABR4GSB4_9EURO